MRRFPLLFLSVTDHKRHKSYEQRERCFRVFRGCFYLVFAFSFSLPLSLTIRPASLPAAGRLDGMGNFTQS